MRNIAFHPLVLFVEAAFIVGLSFLPTRLVALLCVATVTIALASFVSFHWDAISDFAASWDLSYRLQHELATVAAFSAAVCCAAVLGRMIRTRIIRNELRIRRAIETAYEHRLAALREILILVFGTLLVAALVAIIYKIIR